MKYLIPLISKSFRFICALIWLLFKYPVFVIWFLGRFLWHLNPVKAFLEAYEDCFSVFYGDTEERIDWVNYKIVKRTWYYKNMRDFINDFKIYEK